MIILRDKLFAIDALGNGLGYEFNKQVAKFAKESGMPAAKAREILLGEHNAKIVGDQAMKDAARKVKKAHGGFQKNAAKHGGDFGSYLTEAYGKEGAKAKMKALDADIKNIGKKAGEAEKALKRGASGRAPGSVVPVSGGHPSASQAAQKGGFFNRLKTGWNGMSTRNKVLVGGGAAALAAGGAYLASKRRAKARASMESED